MVNTEYGPKFAIVVSLGCLFCFVFCIFRAFLLRCIHTSILNTKLVPGSQFRKNNKRHSAGETSGSKLRGKLLKLCEACSAEERCHFSCLTSQSQSDIYLFCIVDMFLSHSVAQTSVIWWNIMPHCSGNGGGLASTLERWAPGSEKVPLCQRAQLSSLHCIFYTKMGLGDIIQ